MFHMSQSAVFHLHRIARSLSKETQQRFRLSNESDVEELLRLASASRDQRVRQSLIAFLRNCETSDDQHYQFLKTA